MSAFNPRQIGNQIADPATHAAPVEYHQLLARLRAETPLVWVEPDEYPPFWIVTRHADIMEIERAVDVFKNAPRTLLRKTAIDEQIKKVTGGRPFLLNNLTNMDGDEHKHHRKLTQAWFAPGRIKVLEQELRAFARQLFDRTLTAHGEVDFMKAIASWYPLRVIMRIIGVPAEDQALMLKMTQQLFGPDDPEIRTEQVDVISTVQSFFAYFRMLIERRRANPQDDLATLLSTAEIGEPEALSYFILAATAGHDTTSSSIAGGMLALLENPAELAKLRADMSLLPTAIDEMIRWVTPVTHFFLSCARHRDQRHNHTRGRGHDDVLSLRQSGRDGLR